jgi:tRNA threonylcarbamoyladenosine biosynthesis protein TsaE
MIHHFDLYRIHSPEELHFIGIHDYFHSNALVLIEWPEKGEGVLPPPTTQIRLTVVDDSHRSLDIQ